MNVQSIMRSTINRILGSIGYRVVNANWGPVGFTKAFKRIRANGLEISSICDIGASNGAWTIECMEVFPDAEYFLIDPLIENASKLDQLCSNNKNCIWWNGALGDYSGELLLKVDGDRTSVYPTMDRESFVVDRKVDITTLDGLYLSRNLAFPDLVKLDVQGHELSVLRGATKILEYAKVLLVECSYQEVYNGIPLIADVVKYLREQDFQIFDIATYSQRPKDGFLAQSDVVFARNDQSGRLFSAGWDGR